jgi:predicted DNA-binding transcriptional regulator AlpA
MTGCAAVPDDSKKKKRAPNPNSLTLTPAEAMEELRISRATLFKLLRKGDNGEDAEIESFLIGPNARRIPRASIEAYVARKLAAAEASQRGAA